MLYNVCKLQQGNVIVGSKVLTQHEYGLLPVWNTNSSAMEFKMFNCFEEFHNYGRFEFLPYGELLNSDTYIFRIQMNAHNRRK